MLGRQRTRNLPAGLASKRKSGFTLVEIGLAVTVLLVAVMAMSASTIRTHGLRRQNRERAIAQNAIRQVSEEIHATSDQIRRTTAGVWSQDLVAALAAGGAIGNTFPIRGLTTQDGQAVVGTITLVLDETVNDEDLGVELGMPRDLDSDGSIDNANVVGTASIIPIIVRARWRGVSGDVQITHPFYIVGY